MTTASETAYVFQSSLPKDAAGRPFWPLVRSDASVAPFTLPRGIGASLGESGYLFSSMGIGTQVRGASLTGNYPVVGIGGLYLDTPSASEVESGYLQSIQSTKQGGVISEGHPKTASLMTTSVNSISSRIVYGFQVAGIGVTAGDTISLQDGDDAKVTYVFPAANGSEFYDFNGGLKLSAGVKVVQSISGGAASATILYV